MKYNFLVVAALMSCGDLLADPLRSQVAILERGTHFRVVQAANETLRPDGTIGTLTNRYIEIANGLCYENPRAPGTWLDTREVFRIVPEGAVADEGPHRVYLDGNIANLEPVKLITSDGKQFVSKPWGLVFRNIVSGQQALIAEVKDCQGILAESNVVAYIDAFKGCKGIIRYTYTRAGLEQDVLLLDEGFGRPEEYGMEGKTTVIEMWSEFIAAPPPAKTAQIVDGLSDETLNFGEAVIQEGRAFNVAPTSDSIPVIKSWVQADNRAFLVEAVRYDRMRPLLDSLKPQGSRGEKAVIKKLASQAKDRNALMAQFRSKDESRDIAAIVPVRGSIGDYTELRSPAVLIDYQTINGTFTSPTFSNDTFYISGPVYASSQVTIEAGAVFKYATNAFLQINSGAQLNFQGSPYWPVIFTAKDDNSVGQTISGSSGSPSGYYGNPALRISGNSQNSYSLLNLRVCYAQIGLQFWYDGPSGTLVRHAQFVQCQKGIKSDYASGTLKVQNALFHQVQNVFDGLYYASVAGQHITVDSATWLNYAPVSSSLTFQNSLLASVSNVGSYSGSGNAVDNTGIAFETAGEGAHYLAGTSSHRDQGTGAIDSDLASDLPKMTTSRPSTLASPINVATTLQPAIARDTGAYDRGYHYWPLDFLAGEVIVSAPLLLSNGVCIAVRGAYAFDVRSPISSMAGPVSMNHVVSCQNVQEQPGYTGGGTFMKLTGSGYYPSMKFRFTEFTIKQGAYGTVLDLNGTYPFQEFSMKDCRLRGASWSFWPATSSSVSVGLTNNLIERCSLSLAHSIYSQNTPFSVNLYNNLFRFGSVSFTYDSGTANPTWRVYDNLFDAATQNRYGASAPSYVLAGYNGFTSGTANSLGGSNNKTGLTGDYQTGPFGAFYYPGSGGQLSQLLNAGSQLSSAAGLYHHTTRNDGTKELNSQVDIGCHFIAANANGQPVDSDTDGLPDYFENQNGSGVKGSTESDFTLADTDADGLSDGGELSLGTDPNALNTLVFQMTDENNVPLSSPVMTEKVALRTDLKVQARLDGAPNNIPGLAYQWTIGGNRIKTYEHDIDEVTPFSPSLGGDPDPARHRHQLIALNSPDLTTSDVSFFWTQTGNPNAVTVSATKGFFNRQTTINFTVNQTADPSKDVYTFLNPDRTANPLKTPDGLLNTYNVLVSHTSWHTASPPFLAAGGSMADGEHPVPIGFDVVTGTYKDTVGGEPHWGDLDILSGITYNGSAFLMWHRHFLDAHIAWRVDFNVPTLQVGLFPPISQPHKLNLPEYLKYNPSPIPVTPTAGVASGLYAYRRLGEFQTLDELGRGIGPFWHNAGHVLLSETTYDPPIGTDPLMSNLDSPGSASDLFWIWHTRVNEALVNWIGPDLALTTAVTPAQGSTITGPVTEVIVAFDKKVSAGYADSSTMLYTPAPQQNVIQLKPSALKVNGVAATDLYEYGGSSSRYMVFRFTGFTVPGSGLVTCDLTGTASYEGKTWAFTSQ